MKIFKRTVYTLLSILLLAAVAMVGIILYAEYSGSRFLPEAQPDRTIAFSEEESRLVYDENGNLAELPEGIPVVTEDAQTEEAQAEEAQIAENQTEETTPVIMPSHAETAAVDTGDSSEQFYIMDKNSNLFHTSDCPYAANIAAEYKAQMMTTREKIMNAAYQPCSNCNP